MREDKKCNPYSSSHKIKPKMDQELKHIQAKDFQQIDSTVFTLLSLRSWLQQSKYDWVF